MSIREGAKSLLRKTANLAQWLRFNLSNSIEIGRNSKVRGAKIAKNVKIGSHCNIQRGRVSSFSYMGDYCELPQVEIGKFCSIAAHVTLAAGNHPMSYVSTSPTRIQPSEILLQINSYIRKSSFIPTKTINISAKSETMFGSVQEQHL